jgi:hypothetical protein
MRDNLAVLSMCFVGPDNASDGSGQNRQASDGSGQNRQTGVYTGHTLKGFSFSRAPA